MRVRQRVHITACGSGNFLIQAYKHLRGLEYDIITRAEELELADIQEELAKREGQRMGPVKTALIARRDAIQAGNSMQLDAAVLRKSKITMRQFYGIEINAWPAKVAATAMLLVDHLCNQAWGQNVVRLPIEETPEIILGNALRTDWENILPDNGNPVYVFGNPPFHGDGKEAEQLEDLQLAWGPGKQLSRLDYCTGWHAKSLKLLKERPGMFAFVTTNSINQGDQTARLFEPIFDDGWRIRFAHRTFEWDSAVQGPGKAAVHCVIIGFDRCSGPGPYLWDYPDIKGPSVSIPTESSINAYLIDGPNLLVGKSSKPISPEIAITSYGSKPTDDGNLIIEPDEYAEFMADPIAAKYVHRFVGARELLRGTDRWCLWLDGMDPEDLSRSLLLKRRVEAVRDFRVKSKAATTREFAQFPHLFRQRAKQDVEYLSIPIHVSETRYYYPVLRVNPEVISSNANFTLPDPDGLQFGLISSSMFITWQKTVGGRIKSDLRFGSTLTWYTFPVPQLGKEARQQIIKSAERVLAARALYPDCSLAQLYDSKAMPVELLEAHDQLDIEVDRAFGAPGKVVTFRERQEILFDHYVALTSGK